MAGSTSIAEKLGPERSKFLFDEVVVLMREEVERFGGTVAQLTGRRCAGALRCADGARGRLGAGRARGARDAQALARYAAEVGARATGSRSQLASRSTRARSSFPCGDATPDVLYNALGDTVNVAARLQALGDLVVGQATARQVDETFELEQLGELELKGKERDRQPRSASSGVHDEPRAHVEPPLVGRAQELGGAERGPRRAAPRRGARSSRSPASRESGSRVSSPSAQKRFAGRVRFLAGHAVSYAETIPYWPVREQLRSWLGVGLSDAEARIRIELRAELARSLGDEAEEAYPFLATLLGLTLQPEQEQRLGSFASDAVQRQTFDWLFQLVCSLARERPLCLVLEDLHWSDEATLALLDELLPATEEGAVGFLLIHRSDPDHPAWHVVDRARRRFRHMFLELELEPLPDIDTRALAEADAEGELPRAGSRSSSRSGPAAIRTSWERRFATCASAAYSSGRTAGSCSSASRRSRRPSRRRSRRGSTGSTPRRANS